MLLHFAMAENTLRKVFPLFLCPPTPLLLLGSALLVGEVARPRRGSNSLPGIPRMALAIRRSPASPQIKRASHRSRQRLPACPLSHSKRENPILTDGIFSFGAGDEARTRYLDLGKVALYQMSYARKWRRCCGTLVPPVGVEPTTRGFSVRCSTN